MNQAAKKTELERKQSRYFKAGLTNGLNERVMLMRQCDELSLFLLEDSLTDNDYLSDVELSLLMNHLNQ